MTVSLQIIRDVFEQSLSKFLEQEVDALLNGVSERNNCGRLAMYMQASAHAHGLVGYFADTEYNRKQNGRVKTILDDDQRIVVINCDLILHSRGINVAEDNLIAVEMKKHSRPPKEKATDRYRIRALTQTSFDGVWSADGVTHPEHVCGYILGTYVEIDRTRRTVLVEYYSRGILTELIQRTF